MNKNTIYLLALLCVFIFLTSCFTHKKQLKIAASPVPHAEILEQVKEDLKEEGIDLVIIEVDDYQLPNRLLQEKEVDANFFQHTPFLEQQIKEFHYDISPLAAIHIEPLGVYSKKITSLKNLKKGLTIAIPSDPSNEARALLLLSSLSLIELDDKENFKITLRNVKENNFNFKFYEVDAPFLTRTLQDVDLAVIPANFALQAHLNPLKDAIALESENSPYVNIVAVRTENIQNTDLQKLAEALTSKKIKKFILEKYKGSIIPTFN